MRNLVFALTLAGCGFSAPAGQQMPIDAPPGGDDAPAPIDAPEIDAPEIDAPMIDAMIDAPVGPQCPSGYAPIPTLLGSTSQYRFVSTRLAWGAAEMDCEDDGDSSNRPTHLIVLDDAAERSAMIAGPLGAVGSINDQWIGLTDLEDEEDGFEYITNQQNTLSLNPGMNNANKDCVRIKDNGNAEARDCTEINRYVCECDSNAANPSRFPNLPNGNND